MPGSDLSVALAHACLRRCAGFFFDVTFYKDIQHIIITLFNDGFSNIMGVWPLILLTTP